MMRILGFFSGTKTVNAVVSEFLKAQSNQNPNLDEEGK